MDAIGSLGVDQMTLQRWIKRSAPLAAAVAVSAASVAVAQAPLLIGQPRVMSQQPGSELFEWTGTVDREVQIVMRGNNVWTNNAGQSERPHARTRSYSRLPNENGQVSVRMLNGRGQVDVIQQPSRSNDYTTIVRVRDDRSGSSDYRLAAYWQGYANGDVYGNRPDNRDRGVYSGNQDNRGIYGGNQDGRGIYGGNQDNRGGRNRGANSEALHWSGNVDGDLEIRIQNGRVDYRNLSGSQPTNIRSNVGNTNALQSGNLRVQINQGRGDVDVVQQPQQWNGYTTVIRVRDPQGGAGYYDFSIVRQ
jgi:hypothetical protein